MPAKKTGRYRVLRDVALPAAEPGGQGKIALAGETVDVDDEAAALLIRDGMLAPSEGE